MKKLVLFLTILVSFSQVSALSFSSSPEVTSTTDTSVSLSWEPIEGAILYYVYYAKKPSEGQTYEFQSPEVIENETQSNTQNQIDSQEPEFARADLEGRARKHRRRAAYQGPAGSAGALGLGS